MEIQKQRLLSSDGRDHQPKLDLFRNNNLPRRTVPRLASPQPPTAEANSAVAVNSGRFNGDNVPRPTSPALKIKPKGTRYRFPPKTIAL